MARHPRAEPAVLISVALSGFAGLIRPTASRGLRPDTPEKGRRNAIGFIVGWAFALAPLFTAAFVGFSAGATDGVSGTEKRWLSVLELILAAALVAVTA